MATILDQIIVIDIEATCWEKTPPPGQKSEIIEIGICPLDIATGRRLAKESILVRPVLSEVSPFCTQLTTLTAAQVVQGMSFAEACTHLQKHYLSPERIWASYGDYDRQQFEKQCQLMNVAYPFNRRHINIKTLLSIIYGLPRELGMAEALKLLNLPLEGIHHRGDDDAWNIGGILSKLLLQRRATQ